MPATQENLLTLDEFRTRYAGQKPYYEYWAGEAIQKSMPTWLHGLIQKILMFLLDGIGYESASEVSLRLDPAYEPVPDVIAVEAPAVQSYPTAPFAVAIEILSPEDSFSRVVRKCRLYEQWGIERIIVIDPSLRAVWSFENGNPRETDVIARRGGKAVTAGELWNEVDRRMPLTPRV
jgi:Uma2 family endonuclease